MTESMVHVVRQSRLACQLASLRASTRLWLRLYRQYCIALQVQKRVPAPLAVVATGRRPFVQGEGSRWLCGTGPPNVPRTACGRYQGELGRHQEGTKEKERTRTTKLWNNPGQGAAPQHYVRLLCSLADRVLHVDCKGTGLCPGKVGCGLVHPYSTLPLQDIMRRREDLVMEAMTLQKEGDASLHHVVSTGGRNWAWRVGNMVK